jgi:hypothetical protein
LASCSEHCISGIRIYRSSGRSSAGYPPPAAGLLIATGIKMLLPHRGRPTALFFAALAFVGIIFAELPLLAVLLGLVPLSIAVAAVDGLRGQ